MSTNDLIVFWAAIICLNICASSRSGLFTLLWGIFAIVVYIRGS